MPGLRLWNYLNFHPVAKVTKHGSNTTQTLQQQHPPPHVSIVLWFYPCFTMNTCVGAEIVHMAIVRVNELCVLCWECGDVWCVCCTAVLWCSVWQLRHSYTVLDPNICCCLREGGCSGAANLATIFRGSFYSIQRRRFSNTVSLLKAPSVVVGTFSEYSRSFVATSSGGWRKCDAEC